MPTRIAAGTAAAHPAARLRWRVWSAPARSGWRPPGRRRTIRSATRTVIPRPSGTSAPYCPGAPQLGSPPRARPGCQRARRGDLWWRRSTQTGASRFLPYGPKRQRRNHVPAGDQQQDDRHDRRDRPDGGHLVPDDLELGHQTGDPNRERLRPRGRREDEGKHELAPGQRKGNHGRSQQRRGELGEDNFEEGVEAARAVHERRLFNLQGDLKQGPANQPRREREAKNSKEAALVDGASRFYA